jgi:hypothetical protein
MTTMCLTWMNDTLSLVHKLTETQSTESTTPIGLRIRLAFTSDIYVRHSGLAVNCRQAA